MSHKHTYVSDNPEWFGDVPTYVTIKEAVRNTKKQGVVHVAPGCLTTIDLHKLGSRTVHYNARRKSKLWGDLK